MVNKPNETRKKSSNREHVESGLPAVTSRHFFVQYLFFAYDILVVLMGVTVCVHVIDEQNLSISYALTSITQFDKRVAM